VKITRTEFLSNIYTSCRQVMKLAYSSHIFRTEARDVGCVSQRLGLCGPAKDAEIVRGSLESLDYDRILAMLPIGIIGLCCHRCLKRVFMRNRLKTSCFERDSTVVGGA
jgi:hypothetical protein